MSETFIPISDANADLIEDMFIRNANSQVYISAAVYRRLDFPKYVEFLVNEDETLITIRYPRNHGVKLVKVNVRGDSHAARLRGVPKRVMRLIDGRLNAVSAGDKSVTFKVG